MRRLYLAFLSLILVSSVLKAQTRPPVKRPVRDSGYSISDSSFRSSLEYQQSMKNGCTTPRFNVTCAELLLLWQQALPNKRFAVIGDVEQYLLTSTRDVKCGSYMMDVGGIALPSRKVGFRPKRLEPNELCVEDKQTGKIVAILKCGNPTRPLLTQVEVPVVTPRSTEPTVPLATYKAVQNSLRECEAREKNLRDSLSSAERMIAQLRDSLSRRIVAPKSRIDTVYKTHTSKKALIGTALASGAAGFVGGYFSHKTVNTATATIIRNSRVLSLDELRLRQSQSIGFRFTVPIGK